MLRLLGRISRGEEGNGTKILGKKIKILKNVAGNNIKLSGTFTLPIILLNIEVFMEKNYCAQCTLMNGVLFCFCL